MTPKRFSVKNNWIKDNCIGKLLNIDFNTITDANLCCKLLNQIENEKKQYGKIASKFLEENTTLKEENEQLKKDIENLKITIKARETLIDVCEKKFNELGYIITVDDDGYVIE